MRTAEEHYQELVNGLKLRVSIEFRRQNVIYSRLNVDIEVERRLSRITNRLLDMSEEER